jgi:hypothetical protein
MFKEEAQRKIDDDLKLKKEQSFSSQPNGRANTRQYTHSFHIPMLLHSLTKCNKYKCSRNDPAVFDGT